MVIWHYIIQLFLQRYVYSLLEMEFNGTCSIKLKILKMIFWYKSFRKAWKCPWYRFLQEFWIIDPHYLFIHEDITTWANSLYIADPLSRESICCQWIPNTQGGRLICHEGHVSSLNKCNPIQYKWPVMQSFCGFFCCWHMLLSKQSDGQ